MRVVTYSRGVLMSNYHFHILCIKVRYPFITGPHTRAELRLLFIYSTKALLHEYIVVTALCICAFLFADIFRRATFPAAVHRSEGAVLHGLLHVRHGHQPDRSLSRHRGHAHPLQRVRCHVQHSLHNPFQLDS